MYKRILIAVPNGEKAEEIIATGVNLALRYDAEIILCHIKNHTYMVNAIPSAETHVYASIVELAKNDSFDTILDKYSDECEEKGVKSVEVVTTYSSTPSLAITDVIAPGYLCDLIVCGSSEKKGFFNFIGNTASSIVKNAKCDVHVVKCK